MSIKYKLLLPVAILIALLVAIVVWLVKFQMDPLQEILYIVLFLAFSLLSIGYVVFRALSPLNTITSVARGITYGNYDLILDIKSNDEFGRFAKSFNEAVDILHQMIIEKRMEEGAAVKRINLIENLMQEIRNATLELTSCATQMMATTEQQASGASEQSSAVTETSATMEELSRTASAIAENAYNVTRAAERTLIEMKEVNAKVSDATKKILALGEKSQTIGKIIAMIDDLSSQTNLLALNAAIEAARAGEAGRGFAVVASEIRKLAERSVESTEEIRQLINEIQAGTNSVVIGIEDSTKGVSEGLSMVEDTAKLAKEISLATQQQKSASSQVSEAMKNVDTVTKQIAVSAKQSVTSATKLGSLAGNLKKAVNKFRSDMGGANTETADE
ncbi:MAG: hypothetical protein COV72_03550 [Candidatus Omnitrophica bacterium CG11_big_fil_rev_8_21_14_0_20_42_13]|uniref:Methyl-accepting chemotaxis protein n=1 Tax=Candidatus Ghiorseimicrobium undicola TaxID=1974746 RepID=A0A2H0M0T1_9BACT|nr:MAG: hypothetical protein COV72_03550 [Candidatus Omnitrophica bacterium CG11_big_fil_rev_8_21_14_0_20_42_13]